MKKILGLIAILIFLSIISTFVLGYFVYIDAQDIDANFANSTNLYLFEEDGQIKYGFKAKGFGLVDKDMLVQDEVDELQLYYEAEAFEEMVGENYKMIIFEREDFEDKNQTELQSYFDEQFLQAGPALIFKGMRDGDVSVYPETPFFKITKFLPGFIANRMRMFEEN